MKKTSEVTKWTAPPWHVEKDSKGFFEVVNQTRRETVARYVNGMDNARLLAAAAELYNALATIIKRGYAIEASDHADACRALHKAFCETDAEAIARSVISQYADEAKADRRLPCGCRVADQLLCTHGYSQLA